MELDRPVLITGTPRSGKSVIAAMLDRLDEFTHVEEPLMVWDTGLGSRPDDVRRADEATGALREAITGACAALIASSPGTRYLDNLAYHALRVPFIHAIMPSARIIHVIRRPQDAIPEMSYGWSYKDTVGKAILRRRKSIRPGTLPRHAARFLKNQIARRLRGRRATWGPRVPGMAAVVAGQPVAQIAAYQWMQMVQIARDDLEKIPRDRWLEVHFDRLLQDPATEAARIGRFCGVDSPESLADIAEAFIDPGFIFEKRVEPSPAEWSRIHDMIRPFSQGLGYAD